MAGNENVVTGNILPSPATREVFAWERIDPKTVIAILVVGGLMLGWLGQKWLGTADVPDWLMVAAGTIIGFWYRDKAMVK